jgi:membrane-bound lytic murein transglycosylase D
MIMKKLISITILFIALHFSVSAKELDYKQPALKILNDTIKESVPDEDEAIEEVVKSRTAPKLEKVQYFNQITKYGFKNLFKNLAYNPAMPYSSQVNPYAETYMQDYLQAHGNYLQKMKGPSMPYFNLIDHILAQYGLPKELKYLAVIESDLKSKATSWAGARGPWQFMSYTAKDYGLRVNSFIDDRTDYYKSTDAAARYLLLLYKDLKDWLLVIAAYNGGPGRVYEAIRKSGSRNFWALQYYLPTESRNHVKKFIATHYIMEATPGSSWSGIGETDNPPFLKNPALSEEDNANTEVLNISGKYNSLIIVKNLSMDINEFNRLNTGFDGMLASGNAFDLRLTSDKMDLFVRNKYDILNECVQVLLSDVNTATKTTYTRHNFNQRNK